MFKKAWKLLLQKRTRATFGIFLLGVIIFFIFCLPSNLFDFPTSTILLDKNQQLLSAQIAKDGQWRFPHNDSVASKFGIALITFEDHRFLSHSGISLRSIFRAIKQNFAEQKIVSGASTITMQVIRMSRRNPRRTIFEKLTEMIRAFRLEFRYSKDEILAFYSSNAPMGGNVVGLDAAAWRYFGRSANNLSWAESATLAVLPNAPSLIYPGKNQKRLFAKRNRLLKKLHENGVIDKFTYELSILELLPQKPHPLPQVSTQLLSLMNRKNGKGKRLETTLDKGLQLQAMQVVQRHNKNLKKNHIYNAAVIIIDVKKNEVMAYMANTKEPKNGHNNQVDIIQAPRSTGSILKPFLYGLMLNDGELLPQMLVKDVPAHFSGYSPKNYTKNNEGAVAADRALSRSLNIPAVFMLKNYGVNKFQHQLQRMNFNHLFRPSTDYGLSLILGGAEASLWEISNAYAAMSRDLSNYTTFNGKYWKDNYNHAHFLSKNNKETPLSTSSIINASSVYTTMEALLKVNRPENEVGWGNYSSSSKIAWKTGTSFGFRDAWAVGVTSDYVVGVWVGNADGEGRPGIVGVKAAAPLLFDIFDLLPSSDWFMKPYDDMQSVKICKLSGFRAGQFCDEGVEQYIPDVESNFGACPYHQRIHINDKNQRVNRSCEEAGNIHSENWFVLPAIQEWYYKKTHPTYKTIPDFSFLCREESQNNSLDLIYPKRGVKIYIPKDLNGEFTKIVFKAAYRNVDGTIYWHLDNEFVGETSTIHHIELRPKPGKHKITLVNEDGVSLTRSFDVIEKGE